MSSFIQEKPKLPMCRINPYETQKSAYEDESMSLSHRSKISFEEYQKRIAEIFRIRGRE
tara:strand:- start:173 stop:349 length:177 start_codon:yes stop_codon:yes gene_type:complete